MSISSSVTTSDLPLSTVNINNSTMTSVSSSAESLMHNDKINPNRFLTIGDSIIQGELGGEIDRALTSDGYYTYYFGKFSTGLNRVDYFDWTKKAIELINEHTPDTLIVYFGANDGQDIVDSNGNTIKYGADGWKQVYGKRVEDFLITVSPLVKHIYWIGHPIAGSTDFYNKFVIFNGIYIDEIMKFDNVSFIDTWDRLAINGTYTQIVTDDYGRSNIARLADGVHLTEFGAQVLTKLILEDIGVRYEQ